MFIIIFFRLSYLMWYTRFNFRFWQFQWANLLVFTFTIYSQHRRQHCHHHQLFQYLYALVCIRVSYQIFINTFTCECIQRERIFFFIYSLFQPFYRFIHKLNCIEWQHTEWFAIKSQFRIYFVLCIFKVKLLFPINLLCFIFLWCILLHSKQC